MIHEGGEAGSHHKPLASCQSYQWRTTSLGQGPNEHALVSWGAVAWARRGWGLVWTEMPRLGEAANPGPHDHCMHGDKAGAAADYFTVTLDENGVPDVVVARINNLTRLTDLNGHFCEIL